MAKVKKSVWGELGFAALGGAIGAVVGMLASPKSGKENRAAVVKKVQEVETAVKKTAGAAKKKVVAQKKGKK